ncbi:uncharacterized protein LOC132886658 [Neoarius graeffei]|uniref:uncharacterized protein LOC132886658 n=1 Tax=Neoarius graeffei TaxID=443677 RepID=UPI00298C7866|nr:uncharacterized protein LOC132886658 [Neoarius graeffei]
MVFRDWSEAQASRLVCAHTRHECARACLFIRTVGGGFRLESQSDRPKRPKRMLELAQCAWWVNFISILVLFLPYGGGSGCSGHQHPNGTLTVYLNETVPVSQYDTWQINNIVQGNETSFNTITIERQGLRYVIFKECYANVTYWSADPGKFISCLYNCSTTRTPTQHPHLNDILAGFTVASILPVVVVLLCIVCGYWKRKALQSLVQSIHT